MFSVIGELEEECVCACERVCMCVRNYMLPGFNIFIIAAYNLYVVVD